VSAPLSGHREQQDEDAEGEDSPRHAVARAHVIVQDGAVIESPPPAEALAWAAQAVGPAASARTVRRLAGGTHAATHLLRTERPAGELVLRRFPPGDEAAAREARVLEALDGLDGWAPRLAAAGLRLAEQQPVLTHYDFWSGNGRIDLTAVGPRRRHTDWTAARLATWSART
jgi:hypothetical protein